MFSDKIDYSHPEMLPYSDGSDADVLWSWIIGAVFAAGLLVVMLG